MSKSLFLATFLLVASNALAVPTNHEPLQVNNTFHSPEEVMKYYCARDASGFVWSGLLDVERRAFTLWKELPELDSFFVARDYQIVPLKIDGAEALIEVRYQILGIGDAHGTLMPTSPSERRVTFKLIRDQGSWKIALPEAAAIEPVVLASKFKITGLP